MTKPIEQWSTTPASNNAASPDGWPEGMLPSGVNDSGREMMAHLATYYGAPEWLDLCRNRSGDGFAYGVSRPSVTTLLITGVDMTAEFSANRRLKMSGGASTVYGFVASSSTSAGNTTVTVDVDDSIDIPSATNHVDLGAMPTLGRSAWDAGAAGAARNYLVNGEFRFWQRTKSFTGTGTGPGSIYINSDGTYIADRWILLSDGNDVVDVVADIATANYSAPSRGCATFDVEQAAKKFGVFQIIEGEEAKMLAGQAVSMSFQAHRDANLQTLGCAIIEWTGAADSPTRDVVSAWNADGADPTLVANWAYVGSVERKVLGATAQTFSLTDRDVSASATNVAVLIWRDDKDDAGIGEKCYLTDVQLVAGSGVGAINRRSFAEELRLCQREFFKTFKTDTNIATNIGGGTEPYLVRHVSKKSGGNEVFLDGAFPVTMRSRPVVYAASENTAGWEFTSAGGVAPDSELIIAEYQSTSGWTIKYISAAGWADGIQVLGHIVAQCELGV